MIFFNRLFINKSMKCYAGNINCEMQVFLVRCRFKNSMHFLQHLVDVGLCKSQAEFIFFRLSEIKQVDWSGQSGDWYFSS
jgi:hypothetical protein